ncbi:L,D-transpeptidase family protein [Thalassobaculum litoreum]|uniref:Murein L,D-transpeptidase YcbB/YkuD n=1 Tax=Thalassobaculum litoreum DSM 18839 TaxID=1123362 RepID=A0A8G2BM28_9PROT|nr:L,D-transpeptidase family protein [Thalassobaculum litoreum]SDG42349.1 Murein L,D-transpeptidase YcbB/YkuD [Thalassobaculum litoreum DSM 18839]
MTGPTPVRAILAAALALLISLTAPALAQSSDPTPDSTADFAPDPVVAAFLAARADGYAWVEENEVPTLNAKGAAVVRVLERAERQGLRPADFTLPAADSPESLDQAVSRTLLRYLTDLQAGRVAPKKVDPELFVFPRDVDGLALLDAVHAAPETAKAMADLAPGNPIYRRLRRLLLDYRALARSGGWHPVPEGPTLKPGMTDPRVSEVRRRLSSTADLTPASGATDLYDPALESAVRQFQRRHGLDADGAIGAKTVAAMNVPVRDRVRQIVLNMERFRWMPDEFGDDHVFVNMAGFELDYVVGGVTRLAMRVIVGRPYRETPVFSDTIRYLEFNPTWSVPAKIAAQDLLPKIKKDPSYLTAGGYELYAGYQDGAPQVDPASVDWAAIPKGRFPYRLRQAPGEKNALGQVKFMFPNQFDVYLHDTPARELFAKSVRNFSSGCIRLQKPITLAEVMLAADGQDPTQVRKILDGKKTARVNLKTPVPVHLTYLTAWIGEGGTVEFRDDIYGRDSLLANALGLI